jgi:hypothetical protein
MSTLVQLQTRLASYLAAEERILQSQEYTVGQGGSARRNRRADLAEVRTEISVLNTLIASHPDNTAARSVRRVRYLRPNF